MRIAAHSDMPFAIVCYAPGHEYSLRKNLRLLQYSFAEKSQKRIRFISLSRIVWDCVKESEGVDYLFRTENLRGFEAAQQHIGNVASGADFHTVEDRLLYGVKLLERLSERQYADKKAESATNRRAERDALKLLDVSDDLREFVKLIQLALDKGYTPHIDDGVLLNAAPLHSLLPSWPETRTAWLELESGDYDWAQQAMEYWPDRVKQKCKTNKSFAIAHGLDKGE
jgi:hypothetical protein